MFNMKKIICLLLAALLLTGCGSKAPTETTAAPTETVAATEAPLGIATDYAVAAQPDMASNTAKLEVTVKQFVDGDTTHFHVPESVMPDGVLKARFLAINTPESTGKIEEWGKKASNFTKEKLSSATSIIIESDDGNWNVDSTGGRHLVWVWYQPQGSDTYRNLNIELLQNGLSIAKSSADNRYGEVCMAAIAQAKNEKLHVHSNQDDPDFYYGDAIPVTLKGLRTNIELYEGLKVAFEGVITRESGQTVYVEEYDPETDMYYGMAVYYGYNLNGAGLEIISVGNEARIVGTVQYYEAGGTYQVSDLNYRMMKPDDPNNIQLISEGNAPAYVLTDPETFANGEVTVAMEEGTITESYAKLAMNTSVEIQNLYVLDAYTTKNEDSASKGAFTLYCRVNGIPITVRTVVLHDEEGNLVKQDAYMGRTINVKGIVDYFNGDYQIKVFSPKDITIVK